MKTPPGSASIVMSMTLTSTTLFVAILILCMGASQEHALAFPITWQLTEFQPNIKNGGRADTIAVNPANNSIMFVASESGGLFKTQDAGVHWSHVDAFAPYYSRGIVYVTSSIMLATAIDDYTAADSGGGIWRSTDGGASWKHIANPPAPTGSEAAPCLASSARPGKFVVSPRKPALGAACRRGRVRSP